jgi:hypothetical protein
MIKSKTPPTKERYGIDECIWQERSISTEFGSQLTLSFNKIVKREFRFPLLAFEALEKVQVLQIVITDWTYASSVNKYLNVNFTRTSV